ncbi:unnamed protein product [Effrenium voratum]|nr:unnamed protein product [Effrenium voratum]
MDIAPWENVRVATRVESHLRAQLLRKGQVLLPLRSSRVEEDYRTFIRTVYQVGRSQLWRQAQQLAERGAQQGLSRAGIHRLKIQVQRVPLRWEACVEELDAFQVKCKLGTGEEEEEGRLRPSLRPSTDIEQSLRSCLRSCLRGCCAALAWRSACGLLESEAARARPRSFHNRALSLAIAAVAYANKPNNIVERKKQQAEEEVSWRRVLDFVRSMARQTLQLGRAKFNSLLSACAKSVRWQEAVEAYNRRSANVFLDELAVQLLLQGLSLSQAWHMAAASLQDIDVKPPMRPFTVTALAQAHSVAKSWQTSVTLLKKNKVAASEREMLEVLCGDCALSSSGTGALRLLAEAKGRRVQISLMAYSFAMHACATQSRWLAATICYRQLRQVGHKPDQTAVKNLALGLSRLRAQFWPTVFTVLQEQVLQQVESDVLTLTNSLQCLSRRLCWAKALHSFLHGRQQGMYLDSYVLCSATSGLGRLARWRGSLELLQTAQLARLLCPALMNSALSALAEAKQEVQAAALLQEMRSGQLEIDAFSMASLAKAFERKGCWPQVLHTFEASFHHGLHIEGPPPRRPYGHFDRPVRADLGVVCSTACGACSASRDAWTCALHLLKAYEVHKLGEKEAAFSASASRFGSVSAWQSALKLIESMWPGAGLRSLG